MTADKDIRDKIIRYSTEIFFAEGFHKVTMDSLALEMRVSKKTIYRFFASKEELIEIVVFGYLEDAAASISRIVEGGGNSIEKLNAIMHFMPGVIRRLDKRFLNDLRVHMPEFWLRVDAFRSGKLRERIGRIIGQGMGEGLVRDFPPELILQVFIGAVRNVANPDFLTSTSLSYNNAVQMTIEMLIGAVTTDKGRKVFKKMQSGVKNV